MSLTAEEIDRLWDYEDPAGSERRFRGLLDAESGERDPNERAEVLTQLARAQGLQARFDEAHRTLDEVQRLLPLSSERVQAVGTACGTSARRARRLKLVSEFFGEEAAAGNP